MIVIKLQWDELNLCSCYKVYYKKFSEIFHPVHTRMFYACDLMSTFSRILIFCHSKLMVIRGKCEHDEFKPLSIVNYERKNFTEVKNSSTIWIFLSYENMNKQ